MPYEGDNLMADPKTKKRGVGAVIREALTAGKSNAEVLAAVKAELPDAKTTMSTVSWYRNQARKAGEPIKTARELKREAKEAEKPDPLA